MTDDITRKREDREREKIQVTVDEASRMISEKFVWKNEFQDIMWAMHDHLRKHNYGMLHDIIHEMLDAYECEQPPEGS